MARPFREQTLDRMDLDKFETIMGILGNPRSASELEKDAKEALEEAEKEWLATKNLSTSRKGCFTATVGKGKIDLAFTAHWASVSFPYLLDEATKEKLSGVMEEVDSEVDEIVMDMPEYGEE